MKWYRIVDRGMVGPEGGRLFIGHIYPEVLHPAILNNLKARGLGEHAFEDFDHRPISERLVYSSSRVLTCRASP